MPCHALPCHALPCLAMPCHALPCHAMPCHALPCLAMPCHALPCLAMPSARQGMARLRRNQVPQSEALGGAGVDALSPGGVIPPAPAGPKAHPGGLPWIEGRSRGGPPRSCPLYLKEGYRLPPFGKKKLYQRYGRMKSSLWIPSIEGGGGERKAG